MQVKNIGQCECPACPQEGVILTYPHEGPPRDDPDSGQWLCEEHAYEYVHLRNPEYTVHCPHCGVLFAVN